MLILTEGGFTSRAHDDLIKSIRDSIAAGKRVFLFVPEQQTLSAEAEMCNILPESAVMSFEVTNFTRFTNTAFRTLGGISGEYITSAGRLLIMWGVLTELAPLLHMTRGGNVTAGIVARAMGAVKELQGYGITPEELAAIEKNPDIADVRLSSKLSDLTLIYSMYKSRMNEKYSDMSEDTVSLAEKLAASPDYLRNTDIYIEGFTSFTEPQYKLIGELMKHTRLTVLLNLPKLGRTGFEYTELRSCESRLSKIADRLSVEKKLLKPDAKSGDFNPAISAVSELLWKIDDKIDNDSLQILTKNPEVLKIFEAVTPFDECDFAASDIKRRVMEGERYRDFGIIVKSTDSYAGILDSALEKAGVPAYMSKASDISSFEAVKLIFTAYSVISRGFRQSDVMTYVKCGLVDDCRDDCDTFEMYVEKWNIDGRRFTDGLVWNMSPNGYDEDGVDHSLFLARINDTKNRILTPLIDFADASANAKTVREHADALLDFLLELHLEERLVKRSRELAKIGEGELSRQNLRLWTVICRALDTVVSILGDTPADTESFRSQLATVFSDMKIGSIPSYVDAVAIGQADMARMSGKKHIYLLGVNRGEFPRSESDTSFFTDRDKRALSKLGLGIEPDLETKNARELYSFSRAFSSARESVRLSYTKKTASLGASMPAEVIERISDITDGLVKTIELASLPKESVIYSPMQALEHLGDKNAALRDAIRTAISKTEYEGILKISEGSLKNEEVNIPEETMAILLGGGIYLSQSRIDSFLKCPFKYFVGSIMQLEENESAVIDHRVIGNFIHSVLESIFNTMIEKRASISSLEKNDREDITERACSEYVRAVLGDGYGSSKVKAITKRISRAASPIVEGLCDEFANCKFTPVCCEMHISKHDKRAADPIIYDLDDKSKIQIGGYIDRIDAFKLGGDVYVRVVDYKTGNQEFSLDKVKEGENLQMLLYLKAVTETDTPEFRERLGAEPGGKILPAGIVYVKTSVKDVTIKTSSDEIALDEVKSVFKRIGASLDDESSLGAMNPDFTPIKNEKSKENQTYTLDDWRRLNDEMESVIKDVGRQILRGDMSARANAQRTAYHPCDKCSFKYICRNPQNK